MSEEQDRIRALHEQLDGSLNVLQVVAKGQIVHEKGFMTTPGGAKAWQVFADQDCNVFASEYPAGSVWPNHEHTYLVEFLVCTSGQFHIEMELPEGTRHCILKAPDALRVPAHTVHRVKASVDSKMIAICIPPERAYQK